MIKISASIVIYNDKREILEKAIESFLSLGVEKELIVVDNSSIASLKSFCEQLNDTQYLFLGKNTGFGKGHNIAFNSLKLRSNIHLILNPDIFFDAQEIESFLKWFRQDATAALAIPQVRYPDGTLQNVVRNIPTPLSLLKRKFICNYGAIRIDDNIIKEIPFAHGCFMAFKTEVFEKINGFDERFFLYMEDVDIWIRAKKFGSTVINTHYKIYHEHRKGSAKNLKLLLLHISSVLKFFRKYKI